jgi:hypothetical protein
MLFDSIYKHFWNANVIEMETRSVLDKGRMRRGGRWLWLVKG